MKVVKGSTAGVVAFLLLVLLWGIAIEPHLIDREEYRAPIPGLPVAWEGRRLALMSDFQVGIALANTGTVRRMVEQVIEERPAAVLIAGDFIYEAQPDPAAEIQTAVRLVRPLPAAGIPTYAVLGNHDYQVKDEERTGRPIAQLTPERERQAAMLVQALEGAGIHVLENEAVSLPLLGGAGRSREAGGVPRAPRVPQGSPDGSSLYLVGISAHLPGKARPEVAMSRVPAGAPRVVMMHNPHSFTSLPPNSAPVAVAGHTHGGQIRLPFTPGWSWMDLVQKQPVHADGWIEDGYGAPGNRLYVTRGVGFSVVPIRINCPPELTFFTLTRVR